MICVDVFGLYVFVVLYLFFFKQMTAYEMRISDWSSDVCSSDLPMRCARFTCSIAAERIASSGVCFHGRPARMRSTAWFAPHVASPPPIRVSWILMMLEIGRASCRERECQYV